MKSTTKSATIKPPVPKKANPVPKVQYRLPDGSYTTSKKRYYDTWTSIGEEFGNIIGGKLFGFDPTFSYSFADCANSQTFSPFTVIRILDYIKKLQEDIANEVNTIISTKAKVVVDWDAPPLGAPFHDY